ncbi:MAG: hypothetical protein JNJ73_06245 [Hyphomonadaceae bacterium]|nr:hypothetical protein [Hyphomonadaceae bacterium]
MSQFFAVVVQRAAAWDHSKPSSEQPDFAPHSAHWRGLEEARFVAMAGLMKDSMDVLFIVRAESAEEVRARIGGDPWQKDGITRIARVEPIDIRFGPPAP